MNTAVAVTGEICQAAIIITGIWAGKVFLCALVPQLRIAPPKTEKQETSQ